MSALTVLLFAGVPALVLGAILIIIIVGLAEQSDQRGEIDWTIPPSTEPAKIRKP